MSSQGFRRFFSALRCPLVKTHIAGCVILDDIWNPLQVFLPSLSYRADDERFRPAGSVDCVWRRESERGLPWMDWHKRDLHFYGCRAPWRLTRWCTLKTNYTDLLDICSCRCLYHVHVSPSRKDWTCQQSIFAEEGNQYKVLQSRWSGVLLAVQTVQLSLWYVKHFRQ